MSYRDSFVLLLRFLAARHRLWCGWISNSSTYGLEMFLRFWNTLKQSGRIASPLATPVWPPFMPLHASWRREILSPFEECQRLLAIPTKRGPTRAVDYLEGDEIGAMLEAVSAQKCGEIMSATGALLLTLFNTGARVQELLDIRPGDLRARTDPLLFASAGRDAKRRLCPLWPEDGGRHSNPC